MAIFRRLLPRVLSGVVSLVVYLLSIKRVRNWMWRKVTGKKQTSNKIVEAKGEIVE